MDDGGGASRSTDPAAGTSSATDVSLREYIVDKMEDRDRTGNERFVFLVIVGAVIWFFVERHLADLNHENARVAAATEGSVSRDTYNANEQQRKSEQGKLDERLSKYDENFTKVATRDDLSRETRGERRQGIDTTTRILGVVFAVVSLMLAYLVYHGSHSPASPTPVKITVTIPKK